MNVRPYLAAGVVAAGLTLGLAAPAGATTADTVIANTRAVTGDMNDAQTAAENSDLDGLETACQSMQSDATEFLAFSRPAGMRRRAWRLARAGMALIRTAGDRCEIGASTADADALTESADLLGRGAAKIDDASAAM